MSARSSGAAGATLLLLTMLTVPAAAEQLVRPTAALEQIPVQGITLAMSPGQAFETLLSAGFQAGDLRAFDDWESDGVEFVRGEYGSPGGYWSLALERRGDRIVAISETYNAPGNPIDAEAAVGDLRRRLDIPADSPKCRALGPHSGLCQLQDAESAERVTTRFTEQIMTVMRIVTISRPKELGDP